MMMRCLCCRMLFSRVCAEAAVQSCFFLYRDR